mgnify:CR=1 FL=1
MRSERKNERITLSIAETADTLGVSRSRVYQLIESNQLNSIVLGRRRLIRVRDIEAMLDAAGAMEAA